MAYLTVMGEKGQAEARYMALVPELAGRLTLDEFSLEAPREGEKAPHAAEREAAARPELSLKDEM